MGDVCWFYSLKSGVGKCSFPRLSIISIQSFIRRIFDIFDLWTSCFENAWETFMLNGSSQPRSFEFLLIYEETPWSLIPITISLNDTLSVRQTFIFVAESSTLSCIYLSATFLWLKSSEKKSFYSFIFLYSHQNLLPQIFEDFDWKSSKSFHSPTVIHGFGARFLKWP